MSDVLPRFAESLSLEDRAEYTIKSYTKDLEHFDRWFAQSNGNGSVWSWTRLLS